MISLGQIFEPYFYYEGENVEQRRADSAYCLDGLSKWAAKFDRSNPHPTFLIDWNGATSAKEFLGKWKKDCLLKLTAPCTRPKSYPIQYRVSQPGVVKMIIRATCLLPLGSHVGSPGYGLRASSSHNAQAQAL